jgi:hypothetical protein
MITMVSTALLQWTAVLLWLSWCLVVWSWFKTMKIWALAAVIMLYIGATLLTYGVLFPWHGVTL